MNIRATGRGNEVKQQVMIGSALNQWCSRVGLPNTIADDAMNLFRRLESRGHKNVCKGRSRQIFTGALVRLAMRERGIYRPSAMFTEFLPGKRKLFYRFYRLIVNSLEMQDGEPRRREFNTVEREISRIANVLSITRIERTARKMYQDLNEKNPTMIVAKNPRALAGACVYLALIRHSDTNIQQVQVARAARVSAVSVRKRAKDISAALGMISTRREQEQAENQHVLQQSIPSLQPLDEGQAEGSAQTQQVEEGDGSESKDLEMGTQEMQP